MEELIKVATNAEGKKVVSARDLYEFLEIKERFSRFMERNLEYGFQENVDYTLYSEVHPQNKQEINDYALTLDTAKEISMIQRSEKGRIARLYFIECEKQLVKSKELTKREILVLALEAEDRALMAEQKMLLAEVKSNQLEIELDKSKEWFTIKKVAFQNKVNWKSLNWRLLKNASEVIGYYPKKVFDANFPEGVNSYNYAAWKMVYPNFDYNFSATL
jgi:phage anti-repressor protein